MSADTYRNRIEALLAEAEASVDLFPEEVDGLLSWLSHFAQMRAVERRMDGESVRIERTFHPWTGGPVNPLEGLYPRGPMPRLPGGES